MDLLFKEQEAMRTKAAALLLKQKEHEQREKDLAQMQKQRRLLRLEMMNILESFPFLFLVFFIAFFLGTISGINLPDGVGCSSQNAMCQNFRFRQTKINY